MGFGGTPAQTSEGKVVLSGAPTTCVLRAWGPSRGSTAAAGVIRAQQ